MKPIVTRITIAIALVFSTAWLLGKQNSALAGQGSEILTPCQAQQLSRDLVPHNSQDFFRQGQEMMEREIQLLYHRQNASSEPVLKIKVNTQAELEHLPQVQQKDFTQSSVDR